MPTINDREEALLQQSGCVELEQGVKVAILMRAAVGAKQNIHLEAVAVEAYGFGVCGTGSVALATGKIRCAIGVADDRHPGRWGDILDTFSCSGNPPLYIVDSLAVNVSILLLRWVTLLQLIPAVSEILTRAKG